MEITQRRSIDLEMAYDRAEESKKELFSELGSLENGSNQVKDLLADAKVELEDYQHMVKYYKVLVFIYM